MGAATCTAGGILLITLRSSSSDHQMPSDWGQIDYEGFPLLFGYSVKLSSDLSDLVVDVVPPLQIIRWVDPDFSDHQMTLSDWQICQNLLYCDVLLLRNPL